MHEFDGSLAVTNNDGEPVVMIDADEQSLRLLTPGGDVLVELDGADRALNLGGAGDDGDIFISNEAGKRTIHLGGEDARISLGGQGNDGDIFIKNSGGKHTIHLGGDDARISLGGHGKDGDVFVRGKDGKDTVHINGAERSIIVKNEEGNPLIHLDGTAPDLAEGFAALGTPVYFNGEKGIINLGSVGNPGKLMVKGGDLRSSVEIDGEAGDVVLRNRDCAEDFPVASRDATDPGTVLVVDDEGRLETCKKACDSRVVGVVSGAGDFRPAIIMGRDGSAEVSAPIAMAGRVFCKVAAEDAPVAPGDLLTTSSVPGHAMRLPESGGNTCGCLIGKALEPIASGRALIPIMVMRG